MDEPQRGDWGGGTSLGVARDVERQQQARHVGKWVSLLGIKTRNQSGDHD